MIFYVKNLQIKIGYLNSSRENIQFKKKNRLKRSLEGRDIEVLKSANFQGFFQRTTARFVFIFVAVGGQIFSKKL